MQEKQQRKRKSGKREGKRREGGIKKGERGGGRGRKLPYCICSMLSNNP